MACETKKVLIRYGGHVGAWRSLVAHQFRVLGVAGSNPVAPTIGLSLPRGSAPSQSPARGDFFAPTFTPTPSPSPSPSPKGRGVKISLGDLRSPSPCQRAKPFWNPRYRGRPSQSPAKGQSLFGIPDTGAGLHNPLPKGKALLESQNRLAGTQPSARGGYLFTSPARGDFFAPTFTPIFIPSPSPSPKGRGVKISLGDLRSPSPCQRDEAPLEPPDTGAGFYNSLQGGSAFLESQIQGPGIVNPPIQGPGCPIITSGMSPL